MRKYDPKLRKHVIFTETKCHQINRAWRVLNNEYL